MITATPAGRRAKGSGLAAHLNLRALPAPVGALEGVGSYRAGPLAPFFADSVDRSMTCHGEVAVSVDVQPIKRSTLSATLDITWE